MSSSNKIYRYKKTFRSCSETFGTVSNFLYDGIPILRKTMKKSVFMPFLVYNYIKINVNEMGSDR